MLIHKKRNLFFTKFIFFSWLVIVLCNSTVLLFALDSDQKIKVGIFQNEPIVFLDASGAASGLYVDILNEIAIQESWEIEYVSGSWSEGLERLANGEIDLMTSITPLLSRETIMDFSLENILNMWGQVFIEEKSTIESIFDLEGKRVAVLRNGVNGINFKQLSTDFGLFIEFEECETYEEVAEKTENGEVFVGVVNNVKGYHLENEFNIKRSSISFSPFPLVFAAAEGEKANLLNRIDFHIATWRLQEVSPYQDALNTWIYNYTVGNSFKFPWMIVYIFLAILLGISFWVLNLRVEVRRRTKDLNESNLRLKQIANNIGEVFWIAEIDEQNTFKIVYVTKSIEKIWELNVEEIIENNDLWFDTIYAEDRVKVTKKMVNFLENQDTLDCEFRIVGEDGLFRTIWVKGDWAKSEDPKLKRVVGIAQDVTNRTKLEQSIAEEKEQLNVTLRSIGDGVITVDLEERIILINKVAENLTGWKQSEAIGKMISEIYTIINKDSKELYKNPIQKTITTGHTEVYEKNTILISREGKEYLITSNVSPINNKYSKMVGVVLVFRDITESHLLSENLQRMDKLNSLGILAGGIAHDFNNLLSGIFGYIELAQQNSRDNEIVTSYLNEALKAFMRTKNLTMQLLTFSKGGEPLRAKENIETVVRDSANFALSGSNISIEYAIEKDIAPCDIDSNQIGQVVDNIIINSMQAMESGGKISVNMANVLVTDGDVVGLENGSFVMISIKDTGTGMDSEVLKQIFDPFFTTKTIGTGLGLATSYSIIMRHNGIIDVESELGKGSTFHVYLPQSQETHTQRSTQYVQNNKQKQRGTILVMDDEEVIRSVVGAMLKTMGFTVLEAKNGNEVLILVADAVRSNNPIDALLLDLTIPGAMGGNEVVGILREKYPDIKAFASSGYSEDPVMSNPSSFGYTDSIQKPFRIHELNELLSRHLM
jgi:PAS domain S-box-containing protein